MQCQKLIYPLILFNKSGISSVKLCSVVTIHYSMTKGNKCESKVRLVFVQRYSTLKRSIESNKLKATRNLTSKRTLLILIHTSITRSSRILYLLMSCLNILVRPNVILGYKVQGISVRNGYQRKKCIKTDDNYAESEV